MIKKKKSNFKLIGTISLFIGLVILIITTKILFLFIGFVASALLLNLYIILSDKLKRAADAKKIEEIFPDFIELVSSNLRAGMTIDKALLLSSRKEFSPLDVEIMKLGKDIITGKDINTALQDLSKRIESQKIKKTIELIISGIRSGGNMATLLEETATSLKERNFVEKKAASNVLMYVIFIFFAVAIGAPILFALSTVLVQILSDIINNIPPIDEETAQNLPLALTSITVSPKFIMYFALTFLFIINILASLVLGLVNKGQEREGLRYLGPTIVLSVIIFFLVRKVLLGYFEQLAFR